MLRSNYPLPEGKIVYQDRPDIVLQGKERSGSKSPTSSSLERGELPESEQVQNKARERVVSKAHQTYLENGGNNIELSFGFDKRHPIRIQRELAKKIADLARRIAGLGTGVICKEMFERDARGFLYLFECKRV